MKNSTKVFIFLFFVIMFVSFTNGEVFSNYVDVRNHISNCTFDGNELNSQSCTNTYDFMTGSLPGDTITSDTCKESNITWILDNTYYSLKPQTFIIAEDIDSLNPHYVYMYINNKLYANYTDFNPALVCSALSSQTILFNQDLTIDKGFNKIIFTVGCSNHDSCTNNQYRFHEFYFNISNTTNILPNVNISIPVSSVCTEFNTDSTTFNYTINASDDEDDTIYYAVSLLEEKNFNKTVSFNEITCGFLGLGCSNIPDSNFLSNTFFGINHCPINIDNLNLSTHNVLEFNNKYMLQYNGACSDSFKGFSYKFENAIDDLFYFTEIYGLQSDEEKLSVTLWDSTRINMISRFRIENIDGEYFFYDSNLDPTALYHFEETVGNVFDSSPNKFNGTAMNGLIRTATGISGNGYQFDGIDDYILIDDDGIRTNNLCDNGCSICSWINTDITKTHDITARWDLTDENRFFRLLITNQNKSKFQLGDGNGNIVSAKSLPFNFQDGYHLVCGTFNGTTTKSGYAKVYIDSVLQDVSSSSIIINQTAWLDQEDAFIGVRDDGSFSNHFSGLMDELSFFNYELTQNQINAVFVNFVYDKFLGNRTADDPLKFSINNFNDEENLFLFVFNSIGSNFNITKINPNFANKYIDIEVESGTVIYQDDFIFSGVVEKPNFTTFKPSNVTLSGFGSNEFVVFVTDDKHLNTDFVRNNLFFQIQKNDYCIDSTNVIDNTKGGYLGCFYDLGNDPSIFQQIIYLFQLPYAFLCIYGFSLLSKIAGIIALTFFTFREFISEDGFHLEKYLFKSFGIATILFVMKFLSIGLYLIITLLLGFMLGRQFLGDNV